MSVFPRSFSLIKGQMTGGGGTYAPPICVRRWKKFLTGEVNLIMRCNQMTLYAGSYKADTRLVGKAFTATCQRVLRHE